MTLDDIMALVEKFGYVGLTEQETVYHALRAAIQSALDEARAERQEWCAKTASPPADCEPCDVLGGNEGWELMLNIAAAIRKGPTP